MHRYGVAAMTAAVMVVGTATAGDEPAAYDPGRKAEVVALPLYLLAEQATLRPQVAYDRRPYSSGEAGNQQTMVPYQFGLLPALAAVAVVHGTELADAKAQARQRLGWLQSNQCQLPLTATMDSALLPVLAQTGMVNPPATGVIEQQDLEDLVAIDQPRQVVQYTTSLNPEMDVLLTRIQVSAWHSASSRAKDEPDWRQVLLVASAPLNLPAKTAADQQALLQGLESDYQASGNAERIAAVNAAGRGADRRLRTLANDTLNTHRRLLRQAEKDVWSEDMQALRRVQHWSANDCALLRQAVDDNATEAARLLQAMYQGQLVAGQSQPLPARSEVPAAEGLLYPDDLGRELQWLDGKVALSQTAGMQVSTAYVYRVLEAD